MKQSFELINGRFIFNSITLPQGINPNKDPQDAKAYLLSIFKDNPNQRATIYKAYLSISPQDKPVKSFDTLVSITADSNNLAALLIQYYILTRSEYIRSIIVQLKPNMRTWAEEHFLNYWGEDPTHEYSDDSDDDTKDLLQGCYQEEKWQNASKTILSKTGTMTLTLQERLMTGVDSTVTNTLTKDAQKRTMYFPKMVPNEKLADGIIQEIAVINAVIDEIIEKKAATIQTFKGEVPDSHDQPRYLVTFSSGKQCYIYHDFHIPLIRGASYLVDRWGKLGRNSHQQLPLERDFIGYSEAIIKTIEGDFYKLASHLGIDQDELDENARKLKPVLLELKKSGTVIFKNKKFSDGFEREFDNFLDYLQYAFSNGIENFLVHIKSLNEKSPFLKGQLPSTLGNPFVPFSKLPFHSHKYAFGLKNPYSDFMVDPLFDHRGKPRKVCVGVIYVALFPLSDFLEFDEPNDVCWLSRYHAVTPNTTIGAENEVSFLSYVENNRFIRKIKLRFPSFHHDLEKNPKLASKYLVKYGLTPPVYKKLAEKVKNPTTRRDATQFIIEWLSLFNSIKLLHELNDLKLDPLHSNKPLLFRHNDGHFSCDEYPAENDFNDLRVLKASQEMAKLHLNDDSTTKTPLFSKSQSMGYTDNRALSEAQIGGVARKPLSGNSPERAALSPKANPVTYSPVSSISSPDKKGAAPSTKRNLKFFSSNEAAQTTVSKDPPAKNSPLDELNNDYSKTRKDHDDSSNSPSPPN